MKKYILLLFLLVIGVIQAQNKQGLKVTYVKAYKKHTDKSSEAPKIMKGLEYELICNSTESRFEYIDAMSNDGDRVNTRFIGRGGGKGVYYKNLGDNTKLLGLNQSGKDFIIVEDFKKYDWKLSKAKTKKILGYDCFFATTSFVEYNPILKENITLVINAWYAPGIASSFGPSGYDGLPGLVLESSTSSFYFIASNIEYLEKAPIIKKPTKGKEVTLKEFNELIFRSFENFKKQ